MNVSDVIELIKPYINNIELLEFLIIGEQLATPDARWSALQDWLKRNKKWDRKVNTWLELSPDAAYIEIKQEVINQAKNPKIFGALIKQFITGDAEARIIASIGNLQMLYKQRKASDRVIRKHRRVRRIKQ